MNEKYLKVIEALGEIIISKDLENSILKYENEQLKSKIDAIENFANNCENVSN